MSRYPRPVRSARLKCVGCNAPVVETVDGSYVCVDCGESPITPHDSRSESGSGSRSDSGGVASDD